MKKVLFLGTPTIAVNALKSINDSELFDIVGVVTNEDKYFGRSRSEKKPSAVKQYAIDNSLEVIQTDKISEKYEELKALDFDFIVSCAFGQFLPDNILELAKFKAINIHASLLPRGRGGAPIHWSIVEGDKKTGISIMDMVSEMDAGNYYQQYEVEITDKETYNSLYSKLQTLIEEKTAVALKEIEEGFESTAQDEKLVTKWLNVTKEDRVINFDDNSEKVYNKIRGLHSIPGANTFYEGKLIKVNSSTYEVQEHDIKPYTIVDISAEGIKVATRDGFAILNNITLPGKKPSEVSELIKGNIFIKQGKEFENE